MRMFFHLKVVHVKLHSYDLTGGLVIAIGFMSGNHSAVITRKAIFIY